jgi:hypothetical protein
MSNRIKIGKKPKWQYDILFQAGFCGMNLGVNKPLEWCLSWIKENRGNDYFTNFSGGVVQIQSLHNGEVVFTERI